jgi:hypothetical protein
MYVCMYQCMYIFLGNNQILLWCCRGDAFFKGCLECRLTRHGAPHFFRRSCSGRFERHKLDTPWRVRRHSKQCVAPLLSHLTRLLLIPPPPSSLLSYIYINFQTEKRGIESEVFSNEFIMCKSKEESGPHDAQDRPTCVIAAGA